VVIEVATASFRTIRGYSIAALIADEMAFWFDGESSANPAEEILAAARPAMATKNRRWTARVEKPRTDPARAAHTNDTPLQGRPRHGDGEVQD
jgi:hypothetical protein